MDDFQCGYTSVTCGWAHCWLKDRALYGNGLATTWSLAKWKIYSIQTEHYPHWNIWVLSSSYPVRVIFLVYKSATPSLDYRASQSVTSSIFQCLHHFLNSLTDTGPFVHDALHLRHLKFPGLIPWQCLCRKRISSKPKLPSASSERHHRTGNHECTHCPTAPLPQNGSSIYHFFS